MMDDETLMLLDVSYEDCVLPFIEGDPEVCAECKSIMSVIEGMITEDYPTAAYFEVDFDPEQQQSLGFCDIYDKTCDDLVQLKIWFKTIDNEYDKHD